MQRKYFSSFLFTIRREKYYKVREFTGSSLTSGPFTWLSCWLSASYWGIHSPPGKICPEGHAVPAVCDDRALRWSFPTSDGCRDGAAEYPSLLSLLKNAQESLEKQVYWVRIRARMRCSPGWAVPAGRRFSEGLQRQWSSSFLRKELLESLDQFSMSLGALGVYFSWTYSLEKTGEEDKWSKYTQMVNPWLSSTAAKKSA